MKKLVEIIFVSFEKVGELCKKKEFYFEREILRIIHLSPLLSLFSAQNTTTIAEILSSLPREYAKSLSAIDA